ncbi:MAG TPA: PPK2 family polyphosphate kinase [Pyrinomonadaceae bacterium]|nr:PPK2 family polyphosphate kinase [Pyrinomonadaceae bacterium]
MDYKQFIYKPGKKIRLKDFDPGFAADFDAKKAQEILGENAGRIAKYQDLLMAHETKGLLVIFQAMDGAGKDAIIKNVMSSIDPQGSEMKMFKAPTEKELRHDYLWRAAQAVPARGQIGVFNRSYYEHVVAERVHPEKLEQYNFPKDVIGKDIWKKRYRHINNFEEYLLDNGIHVLKFFLNLSKEKQREKLLERIERTEKKWKFSMDDVEDRALWDEYMKIYEETFDHTSTRIAEWYIIPDDNRWFARAAVAGIIADKLGSLHQKYPTLSNEQKQEIEKAKEILENENISKPKSK